MATAVAGVTALSAPAPPEPLAPSNLVLRAGVRVMENPSIKRLLAQAAGEARDERYIASWRHLQRAMELADGMLSVETGRFVNAHAYVEAAARRLPPAVLDLYRLETDSAAAAFLSASPAPDIDATARAWRRFRLGSHGGDIGLRLAGLYMDQDRPAHAYAVLRELLAARPPASAPRHDLLLRLAVAAARLGYDDDVQDWTAQLRESLQAAEAPEAFMAALRERLHQAARPATPAAEAPGPAFVRRADMRDAWQTVWRHDRREDCSRLTFPEPPPEEWIRERAALGALADRAARMELAPPESLLVLEDNRLCLRTPTGVRCLDANGLTRWECLSPTPRIPDGFPPGSLHASTTRRVQIAADALQSGLSAGTDRVYIIDNDWRANTTPESTFFNVLHAVDAHHGTVRWTVDGADPPPGMSGPCRLLTLPLETDGRLLALTATPAARLCLVALVPENGAVLWERAVGDFTALLYEPRADIAFLTQRPPPAMCAGGGSVFINVGGSVAAMDTADGTVRWLTHYRTAPVPRSGSRPRQHTGLHPRRDSRLALAQDHTLAVFAHDSPELLLLDRDTGRTRRAAWCPDAIHCIALNPRQVVLVSRSNLVCRSLFKPTSPWTCPAAPAGRPLLTGGLLCVPETEGILFVDAASGQARARAGGGGPPLPFNRHNLYTDGTRLFSLDHGALRAMVRADMERARLEALPDPSPADHLLRGRLLAAAGRTDAAEQAFEAAVRTADGALRETARRALLRFLLDRLRLARSVPPDIETRLAALERTDSETALRRMLSLDARQAGMGAGPFLDRCRELLASPVTGTIPVAWREHGFSYAVSPAAFARGRLARRLRTDPDLRARVAASARAGLREVLNAPDPAAARTFVWTHPGTPEALRAWRHAARCYREAGEPARAEMARALAGAEDPGPPLPAFRPPLEVKWQRSDGFPAVHAFRYPGAPAALHPLILLYVNNPPRVEMLEARTGKALWKRTWTERNGWFRFRTQPAAQHVVGATAFVPAGGRLEPLDLLTGSNLWSAPCSDSYFTCKAARRVTLAQLTPFELRAYDTLTGRPLWYRCNMKSRGTLPELRRGRVLHDAGDGSTEVYADIDGRRIRRLEPPPPPPPEHAGRRRPILTEGGILELRSGNVVCLDYDTGCVRWTLTGGGALETLRDMEDGRNAFAVTGDGEALAFDVEHGRVWLRMRDALFLARRYALSLLPRGDYVVARGVLERKSTCFYVRLADRKRIDLASADHDIITGLPHGDLLPALEIRKTDRTRRGRLAMYRLSTGRRIPDYPFPAAAQALPRNLRVPVLHHGLLYALDHATVMCIGPAGDEPE